MGRCPHCGQYVSSDWSICADCGVPLPMFPSEPGYLERYNDEDVEAVAKGLCFILSVVLVAAVALLAVIILIALLAGISHFVR